MRADDCNIPGSDQIELWLRVRPTPELVGCINRVVTIHAEVHPFNLCFDLPNSIAASQLGYNKGATQLGLDGATLSGPHHLPPFDAPCAHSLDHPDYVLIYLNEGKKSTGLQHQYGNNTTSPFAKLVLYPMVREERMLPRDTTLLSGEALSTFTMRITNPDGSPYHFHGVNFSFSLNFIKLQE